MGQGWGYLRVHHSAQLMVVWIVGPIEEEWEVIEDLEMMGGDTVVPLCFKLPERKSMKVRKKGEVLSRAVQRLESVVNTKLGVWGELSSLAMGNPRLEALRQEAIVTMVGSKTNNTLKVYLPYTVKWGEFAREHSFIEYPAGRAEFVLFVQSLISVAKARNNKSGVVTTAVYAVDFIHEILALPKPGMQGSIKLMLEGARKALARPKARKRALSQEVVWKLIRYFVPDMKIYTLHGLRYAVYCALAFVLEARFADIIDICPNNIIDYQDRMVVFLETQKTDQYREGAFVPFMNSNEPQGAYALLSELLDRLPMGQEDISIFRRVNKGNNVGEFFRKETMSYTLVREGIKEALEAVGEQPKDFGLQSFRSGAKSHVNKKQKGLPEGERIPARLNNKHGRWTENSTAALGYNSDDDDDQLLVPAVPQL
jgi:hypothetical protein